VNADFIKASMQQQLEAAGVPTNQARDAADVLAGLRQISSPNKGQTGFVSEEYVPIVVQPLYKTKRHRCPKRL